MWKCRRAKLAIHHPGVVHAFRNTGDEVMVLVSFSTQPA